MGDGGATGGAWGARDDASWWQGNTGEIQHQQQINEDIARSTATSTHQLYTYKITGGFPNSGNNTPTNNYEYRMISSTANREETPQQPWWFTGGTIDSQQQSSSPTQQNQSSPDPDQGNQQQQNGIQQSHQTLQQQENQLQQQLQQHRNLQQALQQQNQALQQQSQVLQQQSQQQTLQQMLQQQQQNQQALQQSLQQTITQAQAQAIVQAQEALQQQVAQSLQQQQQNLNEQIQQAQQQQIQAALQQQQSAALQVIDTKQKMPRARPFNKPRGRMTAYAFFVQTCREEHKKKHPEENVVFAVFSKKCAERWSTMSEKEKQRFHEMAEQDKQRYDLEMQNYVPPKDVKMGRGRKRHQMKDPNAPKRSLSAFFWFCNDERSKVKGANPEYSMGDIAKELGRRWAAADPETKTKYEKLSEQDKARYDREMTAYKKGPLALVQHARPAPLEAVEDAFEAEEEYK